MTVLNPKGVPEARSSTPRFSFSLWQVLRRTGQVLALGAGLCLVVGMPSGYAQHEHHHPTRPDTTDHTQHHDHAATVDTATVDTTMAGEYTMTHAFSLSLPMTRNGSGTGWQPDATPMYAYMRHGSRWNYMLHASVFLRYTAQNLNNSGRKGADARVSVPNWVMGMAQRQVGQNGLLTLRGMMSLDRPFDGGAGYPLLYQSGETWRGVPLIDRQHPHDLVSELAVAYTQRLGPKLDLTLYAGYPGEPALGPTAFMHRMSAFNNPDAVLGHHWQDATHITFGVVTAGVRYGKFKAEASRFTGREPDENRYNFDKPRFDSHSYRLLFNPSAAWALQVSRGWIKNPEVLHPDVDVIRTTASVQHSLPLTGEDRWLATSLVWGLNDAGADHKDNALLLESNLQLNKWAVYGRYEWIQKTAEELFVQEPAGFHHDDVFVVQGLTLGLNRQLGYWAHTLLQLGAQGTFHRQSEALVPFYGANPVSAQVYLRLTPARMRMN
ncbi:hypothetical protein GCM10027275_40170 [Rhabdobacter roseus]|uniref:Uncharacterized protein n=1 Tax=Rhabdobacter roseus TaxID=1655419 RepID=A0A840TQX2_9BACT|nr:hypothetical protein [Rhabdobacter roseus]MBB5285724.1 hypothetical protein [Rhabdobacter roseus]